MYCAWGTYYEGGTDEDYFNVLLPRILEDVVCRLAKTLPVMIGDFPSVRAGSTDRSRAAVAHEICQGSESFDIFFVHADVGGRGVATTLRERCEAFIEAAYELCGFDRGKAVPLCPRHETEAWAISDAAAVCEALGYRGAPASLQLPDSPQAAERLTDPKAVLDAAIALASNGRRRASSRILPAIAQRQRLSQLRLMPSFQTFEGGLLECLQQRGFLR